MHGTPLIYHPPNRADAVDTCEPQLRAIKAGKIKFHAITHGHYPGATLSPATIPGLSTLGFWDAIGEQDWGLEPHCNEGLEIVFIETGHNTFVLSDVNHRLRAGHLTLTRPWEVHAMGDPNLGPGRLHWLVLDLGVSRPHEKWKWPRWVALTAEDLKELTKRLREITRPVWKSTPEINSIFRSLAECVQKGEPARQASRIIVEINRLLVALLEILRDQDAPEAGNPVSLTRLVEIFFQELVANPSRLADPWTLHSMAERCGIGATAFVKHCRIATNTSPLDYLNRCRLDRASKLLRSSPDLSITDVAFECGYSSSQYFATQFRKRFGKAPTDFRQAV